MMGLSKVFHGNYFSKKKKKIEYKITNWCFKPNFEGGLF